MRYINNEAATQWSILLGDSAGGSFSVGYSVTEVHLIRVGLYVQILYFDFVLEVFLCYA